MEEDEDEEEYLMSGLAIQFGVSNVCPKCKSKRISIWRSYECTEYRNLKSNKLLNRTKFGLGPGTLLYWGYSCRKCGWESETFHE